MKPVSNEKMKQIAQEIIRERNECKGCKKFISTYEQYAFNGLCSDCHDKKEDK
jgi:transcriptional regulator NrdR family protein